MECAKKVCQDIGLDCAVQEAIDKLDDKGLNIKSFGTCLTNLGQQIERECRLHQFLSLPDEMAEVYRTKEPLGYALPEILSSATYDLREASKCLALNRPKACVFHLCLVMELATSVLRETVDAETAPTHTMGTMLKKITEKVTKWPKDTEEEKVKREMYLQVASDLSAFTAGVRNPNIHVSFKDIYSEGEAKDLFCHVKTYLKHLIPLLKPHRT